MSDWMGYLIKMCLNAYKAEQPCDLYYGTILSETPLSVSLEDLKLVLNENQVLLPDHLKEHRLDLPEVGSLLLPASVKSGDRVVLVRKSGSQKYVILGKGE